jgi:hypothetical protein
LCHGIVKTMLAQCLVDGQRVVDVALAFAVCGAKRKKFVKFAAQPDGSPIVTANLPKA